MDSVDHTSSASTATFPIRDYNLAMTLASGQAFRWENRNGVWEGVIGGRWVQIESSGQEIVARTAAPVKNWDWLTHYLQLELDFPSVLQSFPTEEAMTAAVTACRGLRLLRQDPWECLASFILSSTKQIVQIQQIVRLLCECYGEPVPVPEGHGPWKSFPTAASLARREEADLRACKMGFRAPYLRETAGIIARGEVDLAALSQMPVEAARSMLLELPGVGRKIADCVLLFAYGFQDAFPIDVWVMKALQELYFKGRRVKVERMQRFTARHFGVNAGYAQQYLFHYMRTRKG